ncbi:hypothetical protein [Kitasatospora sp. MAP5-34]|uniref:hypothetical protein n=1 Tax=Kitasatospora sp. MAP5-34 TaxID=3035102 RepID=UPI002473F83B|nr:hypothetical protein [Kitasatospora sp. MAP5-34]
MNCADHCAGMSARLDGEPAAEPGSGVDEGVALERLEAHLAACADCGDWLAAALRLKVLARGAAVPSKVWTEQLVARLSGSVEAESPVRSDHLSDRHAVS